MTNKEGLQFYPGTGSAPVTSYVEDANGNKMTSVGPTIVGYTYNYTTTDSLGRTGTTAITYSGGDVTGCPTGGPVAPTTSTIWTIPGPANINNGVRTFKFCYSTINIQTNFVSAA